MNYLASFIFILFISAANGQSIEYRNDSLFLENRFVDGSTESAMIDSLLGAAHETKTWKDEYLVNLATGKPVNVTTDYYYSKGLYFQRYDCDKTALSVAINRLDAGPGKTEEQSGLNTAFTGHLVILENDMDSIKNLWQITSMKNCSITTRGLRTSTREYIREAFIDRKLNRIMMYLDENTGDITSFLITLGVSNE